MPNMTDYKKQGHLRKRYMTPEAIHIGSYEKLPTTRLIKRFASIPLITPTVPSRPITVATEFESKFKINLLIRNRKTETVFTIYEKTFKIGH